MDPDTRKCCICQERSENFSNWLISVINPELPGRIAFGPIADEGHHPTYVVEPVCGESCAHARLSRALAAPKPLKEII